MTRSLFLFVLLLPFSLATQRLDGGVTGVSGDLTNTYIGLQGTPGFSNFSEGQLQSDTNFYVFNEQQGVILGSRIEISALRNGFLYDDNPPAPRKKKINAGTVVDSYLIHFDPLNQPQLSGSISFSSPILGVAWSSSQLNATDFLAVSGTTFSTNSLRGTLDSSTDTLVQYSGNTLSISWSGADHIDELRVITEGTIITASPEPEEALILVMGTFFLMFGLRRSRSPLWDQVVESIGNRDG